MEGSSWHAYRRGWATARKHLPDVDIAAAGGWKNAITLKTVYQQADEDLRRDANLLRRTGRPTWSLESWHERCNYSGAEVCGPNQLMTLLIRSSLTSLAAAIGLSGIACAQASPTQAPSGQGIEASVAECATPAPAWLWCDDFEQDRLDSYFEYDAANGSFTLAGEIGLGGSAAMRARWMAGQVNAGALRLAVGRSPDSYRKSVSADATDLREVYWRLYLRNEPGWVGGGGYKLSRATVFHSPENWGQAMIAHVWSSDGSGDRLVIDPASGTDREGRPRTTVYNDFANLRWLGSVRSRTAVFAGAEIGKWHCIEAYVALNDPGRENGSFRLWIDNRLEAEKTDLNWVGAYQDYGLNGVFIENYWNDGSPAAQERYIDNFVVSSERIGCAPH